jgi:hypothetical protein
LLGGQKRSALIRSIRPIRRQRLCFFFMSFVPFMSFLFRLSETIPHSESCEGSLIPIVRLRTERRLDGASPACYSPDMSVSRTNRVLFTAALACSLAIGGCAPPSPVQWQEVRPIAGDIDDRSMLLLAGDSSVALDRDTTRGPVPREPTCDGSMRIAADGRGGRFAAWWSPRADSNAILLVAAWDGTGWGAPVVADARDRGRAGCRRPAPAIAADATRGYVHLAYYLDAPTGAGVYGGHSMERGTYFHDPVPIVYGDRPVATAIATSGDVAAVAYEDPNSARPRIAVAISRTAGHIYELRLEASPSSMRATRPRIAVRDRRIAVAWSAQDSEGAPRRAMIRLGTIAEDGTPATGGHQQ